LVNDVIFNTINDTRYYNVQNEVSVDIRKIVYSNNRNYKNGLFTYEDRSLITFTFPGYSKDMMYNSEFPRYTPTFNGLPSPDLYY